MEKKKEASAPGVGFNIAMILARRDAIEMTDSDEEDEDDWDEDE
jgi:hypothetical protein